MDSTTSKQEHYEYLLSKLDQAIEAKYFLEATWIAYAVLEDRIESAIKNAGATPRGMFGAKLAALGNLIPIHEATRKAFFGDIIKRISDWKDERNDLMHDLGNLVKPKEQLESDMKYVGSIGRDLAREVCATVRRQKNFI
ncbi:hypothetical protein [Anaerospora hongkongensis]|uniref:hypothetical protein n=1 Tax=Anaerospora hongkongensis TaxID=244830 RepID=UPI00289EF07C|nr:hypothetical protein [Anaerospora hongkongensis]